MIQAIEEATITIEDARRLVVSKIMSMTGEQFCDYLISCGIVWSNDTNVEFKYEDGVFKMTSTPKLPLKP
jgi:uncharacterized membrane protein